MQWYYAIDGRRFGPVPHAELERLMQAGTVTGDALVWRQGMEQWKSLADVQARAGTKFVIEPTVRFEGQPGEQATMFLLDPAGNALEFKAMADPAKLFATS